MRRVPLAMNPPLNGRHQRRWSLGLREDLREDSPQQLLSLLIGHGETGEWMRGGNGVGLDLGDVFDKWVLYYLSRSWRDIGIYIFLIFFSHPGTSYLFIFISYLKVRALLWHP